ncbi:MAG TPA: hypothetical protein VHW23_16505 [Kofleriaceae bacterium]|jgi:hypothetical protein|nr:hypothetical protein [Kofleriaceae bacterium]
MKLVGERRALAAAIMAFYFLLYGVMALSGMIPDFAKAFGAISGVYGLAFFALVAGYFWARWYTVGVGLYGVITAAVGIWQIGAEPVLLFIGGTHLAATVFLWGQAMSEPYDGQAAWREKFHMDDSAVQRLGRSVIRAGVSLPFILLYAFMPRPDAASTVLSFAAMVLVVAGLRGILRLKTWGVLALGVAGALTLAVVGADAAAHGLGPWILRPAMASGMLFAAVAPFLRPILRFVVPA